MNAYLLRKEFTHNGSRRMEATKSRFRRFQFQIDRLSSHNCCASPRGLLFFPAADVCTYIYALKGTNKSLTGLFLRWKSRKVIFSLMYEPINKKRFMPLYSSFKMQVLTNVSFIVHVRRYFYACKMSIDYAKSKFHSDFCSKQLLAWKYCNIF